LSGDDDANGAIIGYQVCYRTVGSSADVCKPVGNVLRITLSKLEKYTSYVVAVQAATKIGFGPLGANRTERTNEDSKYCILFSFLLD
jgi:hypothetical protein